MRIALPSSLSSLGRSAVTRWPGLADQVFYSAISLIQIVVYARLLNQQAFGIFSLAVATSLVAQGLFRSALVLPLVVMFPTPQAFRRSGRWQRAQVLCIASVAGAMLVVALVASALGGHDAATLFLLAAPLTAGTLYFECQRRALYQLRKGLGAMVISAVLLGSNLLAIVASTVAGTQDPALPLLGAGAAGAFAGLLGRLIRGPISSELDRAEAHTSASVRQLIIWNIVSFAPYLVYNNGMVAIVGLVAGPASAAIFAATRIFAAPVQLAINAVDNTDKPRAAGALSHGGPSALVGSLLETAAFLAVIVVPYLLALVLLAEPIGTLLLGANYADYAWMGRCWAVVGLFILLSQPLETGLIILRRSDLLFWSRLAAAAVAASVATATIPAVGVVGALYALMGSWAAATIFVAWGLRHQLRKRDHR